MEKRNKKRRTREEEKERVREKKRRGRERERETATEHLAPLLPVDAARDGDETNGWTDRRTDGRTNELGDTSHARTHLVSRVTLQRRRVLQLEPRAVTSSHGHGPPPTLRLSAVTPAGGTSAHHEFVARLSLFLCLPPPLPPLIALSRREPSVCVALVPASLLLSLPLARSFASAFSLPPLPPALSKGTVRREANADSTVHRRTMPTLPTTAVPTRQRRLWPLAGPADHGAIGLVARLRTAALQHALECPVTYMYCTFA